MLVIGAGQSIGNYRILSKIGTGGMGAVYLAEHPLIGKRVALKVIHRELAGNREVVQRFFQEARAVNTIGNEHIVEIHDFGVTPEGDHFYIMEYLEGRTLASALARDRVLDVLRSLHIGAQIAKALDAAHAAGVIHRDLKPDNVMLTSRLGDPDFVKVLDFGLAKMFAEGASAIKTAMGVLLGTPQYMSPEACESKRVDHRTDIYALGILLFQMMTGVLPFSGDTMGEVLVKQVTVLPPAPRGLNPAIPPSVEQILLRCLAKPPDARFQTMMALREALLDPDGYLRGSPPIAPARSVDAQTVMMAADPRTRVPDDRARLGAMPTAALAVGGPNAQGHGASHPSMQATIVAGSPPAVAAGGFVPPARLPTGAVVLPGLAPPLEPTSNTMRIATPVGYTSRPPRRMWPIVLAAGLVLGLGGGGLAVYCGGGKRAPGGAAAGGGPTDGGSGSMVSMGSATGGDGSAGSASSSGGGGGSNHSSSSGNSGGSSNHSGSSASSGSSNTAGVTPGPASTVTPPISPGSAVAPDAGHEPAALAALNIESVPPNAAVYAADGAMLGRTPFRIDWQLSPDPVSFEFRLAGYLRHTKKLAITGNTTLRVELEKAPARPPPPITPPRKRGSGEDDLMRPE